MSRCSHFFDYKIDMMRSNHKRIGIVDKSPCSVSSSIWNDP